MELLVVLFSLAALVWMIPIIRNGYLLMLMTVVLAVGTILGPEFFHIDGPIQISLDRVLWAAAVVLAVIGWRVGYVKLPMLTRIDCFVVGIVGWFLISALSGENSNLGSRSLALWIFFVVMPAGMYGLARLIPITRWDVRWILGGSILLGLYLAVTAVFEVLGLHSFVFPRYITDPDQWIFFGRGRGPLMNPVGNGVLISIALIAAAIGFVNSGRQVGFAYALIGLVLLPGVYATLTRSVWVGAIAALGMISLFHTPRWARTLALMAAVLVVGLSATGFKDQVMRMKRDKELTAEAAEHSIQLRPLLAIIAWEMFKDRPIAGHGFWQYFSHNDPYHNVASYNLPLDQARSYAQHNVFLAILVDTGLIGSFLFFGFLLSLFGIAWRMASESTAPTESRNVGLLILSALAMYIVNGMFHNLMVIPMVHMFLFFMAGVAVTLHQNGLTIVAPNESKYQATEPITLCPDPV